MSFLRRLRLGRCGAFDYRTLAHTLTGAFDLGLQIILSIHQQDDIAFDDIASLNADLMADFHGGFGELYAEFVGEPGFDGPFKFDERLKIAENWDGDFAGYGGAAHNATMVWGCYSDSVFEIISRHLTAGKLVFFIEIEGNDNEYRVIGPGQVKKVSASEIRF
jgi:hypothetical protein